MTFDKRREKTKKDKKGVNRNSFEKKGEGAPANVVNSLLRNGPVLHNLICSYHTITTRTGAFTASKIRSLLLALIEHFREFY